MGKKAIIIVCSISALLIGAAVLIFVPRDVSIMTTSSTFINTAYHYYDVNPVLKIKLFSTVLNSDVIDKTAAARETELEEAYNKVHEADEDAFRDDYTSIESCVFEVGDYIYYYRTSDTQHIYKYNTATGEITACEPSGYEDQRNGASFRDKYDEVDHNFTVFINIRTEALVDYYPGLRNAINSTKGTFYHGYLFYDNGRIFFDNGNTIYEYLPESDSTRKIASVNGNETVEYVLDLR